MTLRDDGISLSGKSCHSACRGKQARHEPS